MMQRALNTYSLRNEWDKIAKKSLQHVADLCQDLAISRLEFFEAHFTPEKLQEDVAFFADHGIHVFSLAPHTHLLAQEKEIPQMIEDGKYWLNMAAECGAEKIRVQVGDGPFTRIMMPMADFDEEEWQEYNEQIEGAVEFTGRILDPLLETAEQTGTIIGIETHHSYSSNYVYQERLSQRYQSPKLGWIFDIGNYENEDMRWKAVDVIKNRTTYWHAKSYAFEENGFETTLNYPKAGEIYKDAGFDGELSIEFEGKFNGILGAFRTNELLKYIQAMADGTEYPMDTSLPSEKELMQRYSR